MVVKPKNKARHNSSCVRVFLFKMATLYKGLRKFYKGRIPLTQDQRMELGRILALKIMRVLEKNDNIDRCRSIEDIGIFDNVLSYPKKYREMIETVIAEYHAEVFKPKKNRKRIPAIPSREKVDY